MEKKIYAFIVGINDYPDPNDRLSGAVPDTGKIIRYLQERYQPEQLNIKTLLNAEATYQNFVSGFRDHLGQASKEDVIWFHYSGHGSRQATATEMQPYTSGNMDETLVLVDSRPNGRDLADKELGLLLAEVEKTGAHILVSLDCCHSGSGTREMQEGPAPAYKSRMATDRQDARPLDSYLDGYFVKNGLNFPDPKHILLAACNRFQTAKETFTSSGVFTENLVNNLKKTGNEISYADLFVRLRQGVIQSRIPDQDPQIELMGGVNGYVRFLDGSPQGSVKKFPVYQENGAWIMGAGAIQGFQNAAEKSIQVKIMQDESADEIATATITSVSFQKSVLDVQATLQPRARYWAIPMSFPNPPEKILFEGSDKEHADLEEALKNFPQMMIAGPDEKELVSYTIRESDKGLELWDERKGILLAIADKVDDAGLQKLLHLVNQAITWRRINELQNAKTRIDPAQTTVKMDVTVAAGTTVSSESGAVQLANNGAKYPYKITVQNRMKQPLHYCLLYLSDDYGVTVLKNEPIEASDTPTLFWGGGADDYFFLDEGLAASTDRFIVIISTERTDDFELQMDGIPAGTMVSGPNTRGVAGINKYVPLKGEWFTKKFTIRIG